MSPHSPTLDEVGRLVIHLPDDATFYGERSYLPIAVDLVDGSTTPSLLRADQHGVHYMAQYEVFSALCSDRAQRTVDQTLLVGGTPTTPERYLRLWRDAMTTSVSAETAATLHGIRAVAVLQAPLASVTGAKSSWTTCPFGSFTSFRAKYGGQMSLASDGTFALELDLARPGSARDAYYGASMMSSVLRSEPTAWRASIELRVTAGHHEQVPLFAGAEL